MSGPTSDEVLAKAKARFADATAHYKELKGFRKQLRRELRKLFRGEQWTRKQVKRLRLMARE